MHDFSNFISDQGLKNIPLTRGNFTWSNNHKEASMLELIGFFLLQIGGTSLFLYVKRGWCGYAQIISQLYWNVIIFNMENARFNLKICG